MQKKLEKLKNIIKSYESVLIGYSGGVDSTFLAKVAHMVLCENAYAVTAKLNSFPKREENEALNYAELIGINHEIIYINELEDEDFVKNNKDRCYLCKKNIFLKILQYAKEKNIKYVAEASNIDDDDDYRPGKIAISELHIKSPLKEAGLTKNEIRQLSKQLNLPTWEKPSFACLTSRIPYGDIITAEKLQAIDSAEQQLFDLGFSQFRVRHHGTIARIEVLPNQIPKIFKNKAEIEGFFKKLGFLKKPLDLNGYKMGSMNYF